MSIKAPVKTLDYKRALFCRDAFSIIIDAEDRRRVRQPQGNFAPLASVTNCIVNQIADQLMQKMGVAPNFNIALRSVITQIDFSANGSIGPAFYFFPR